MRIPPVLKRSWSARPLLHLWRALLCGLVVLCLPQAAQAQAQRGFLFEVQNKAGAKAWLFGSWHAAKPDFYPLGSALEKAFAKARAVVVEADITNPHTQQEFARLQYVPPDKLELHLSATGRERAQAFLQNDARLQSLRAPAAAMLLSVQGMDVAGYKAELGIDLHFIQRARAKGKQVLELESVQAQVDLLNSFSEAEGEAWLLETLEGLQNGSLSKEMTHLSVLWKSGDEERFAADFFADAQKTETSRLILNKFLFGRNAGMSQKIISMMKTEAPLLVVVGAGHLVGKGSVTELLRNQGLQVRRVH